MGNYFVCMLLGFLHTHRKEKNINKDNQVQKYVSIGTTQKHINRASLRHSKSQWVQFEFFFFGSVDIYLYTLDCTIRYLCYDI